MPYNSNGMTTSILEPLHDREIGRRRGPRASKEFICVPSIEKRIDSSFNDISKCVKSLRDAIDAVRWVDIQHAVRVVYSTLLEISFPDQIASINLKRKQEREIFVSLGGMHLLMRLFEKPFCMSDARVMSTLLVNRHSELWNEVLIILREVCFTIPFLSEQLFGNSHVVFFFTLLVHRSVFENSISMLEEILAVRIETFSLALVPDLFALITRFGARHLAHFCRVLSLVLFEPEDRQILEGSQVLRSLELLQLRRDRVAKSSNIVERNQCLIIDMPDLLKRFLILLRVANYGPNLADLARYNINAQDFPGNADLVTFISISRGTGTSEWDHLLSLDTIVKAAEATGELINTNRVRDTAQPITAGRTTDDVAGATTARQSSGGTNQNQNRFVVSDVILDETMAELLSAFAPNSDTYGQRPIEVSLLNVVQIAQSLGLTAIAPDGEPIPLHSSEALGMGFETLNSRSSTFGAYRRCAPTSTPSPPPTPTAAKKELQFHAMFLNPHHVELLFVLCTLLSGRRKINVQHKLASLGLSDILLDMYGRMSWESKPFHGHNPMEHIHGPGCDCNPESALRVQYLRLVNNSYDRDFLGDSNKMLLLSTAEKELLQRCNSPNEVSMDGFFIGSSDRGIFTRIVQTLLKEPVESVYRFWLSSCLESFLRGSGPNEQVFIAISGILSYTVTHIVDMGIRPSASANLQTAFDLLGELVKGNHHTIEMVDSALGDTNFDRFIDAAMSNLVDSNVFVRSLYLSIDAFSDSDIREYDRSARHDRNATKGSGYLSHSWIQYAPPPLSVMAINMARNKNSIVPSTTQDSSSSNKSKFRRNGTSSSSSVRSDRRAEMQQSGHAVVANTNTPTPVLTSSRITYGVRGALQNIREAASHFLTFSTPISTTSSYSGCTQGDQKEGTADIISDVKREREKQSEFVRHNSQQSLFVPLMKENEGLDGDVEFDYDEFFTPPEAPHYPRLKSVSVKATAVGTTVVENSMAVADTPTSSSSSAFASVSASHTHSPSPGGLDVEDISAVKKNSQIDTVEKESTCVPAVLPKGLHRFHRFLVQEREYVLLRLMITVTIYNINHENICCLNTALLILLLAERRGHLQTLLMNVKTLAEEQSLRGPSFFVSSRPATGARHSSYPDNVTRYKEDSRTETEIEMHCDEEATEGGGENEEGDAMFCENCCEDNEQRRTSTYPPSSSSSSRQNAWTKHSTSFPVDGVRTNSNSATRDCSQCGCWNDSGAAESSDRSDSSSPDEGGDIDGEHSWRETESTRPFDESLRADRVMVNFRELLWYWQEYYLRRGRDRLSIEFSSHIPFFQWNLLVDTLCRDDGSPCALLSAPIALPKSPYRRPPRAHNSSSPEFIQYAR